MRFGRDSARMFCVLKCAPEISEIIQSSKMLSEIIVKENEIPNEKKRFSAVCMMFACGEKHEWKDGSIKGILGG